MSTFLAGGASFMWLYLIAGSQAVIFTAGVLLLAVWVTEARAHLRRRRERAGG